MAAALDGINVLELALQYPGPYCSTLLSGLGARVIKVERPGVGDAARRRPAFFDTINRNKKSLTLDLKTEAGKEIFYRLVENMDVITEGFRPGVTARLGIDYATLSNINPRLVYCSISGFGQDGPYHDLPGHDLNYMSLSGMLHYFRDAQDQPILPGVAIADLSAAMFAVIGIMAALTSRQKSGRGQYVDVSMLDGLLSWMGTNLSLFANTGKTTKQRDAGYGLFETADGKQLALGIAHENWFWDRLCQVMGLENLKEIPGLERNQRRTELVPQLQAVFLQKPLAEWLTLLQSADIPATAVLDMDEVLHNEHAQARGMLTEITSPAGEKSVQTGFPVKFSPALVVQPSAHVPTLGENTGELLQGLGYSATEIDRLRNEKVI